MPDLTGPLGGVLAMALGAGMSSGWLFCMAVRVKPLEKMVAENKTELKSLRDKIEEEFWKGRSD